MESTNLPQTSAREHDLFEGSMTKASSATEHVKRDAFKAPNPKQSPLISEESKMLRRNQTQAPDLKEQTLMQQSEYKRTSDMSHTGNFSRE